jgi:hypothetical protein
VDFANPGLQSALRRFELEDHAARNHARMNQPVDLFARDGRKDFLTVQHAGNVREVDQMVGFDELRASGGHVVGIDVV